MASYFGNFWLKESPVTLDWDAGVLMNEWARSQCFDDQDMLTRINCAGKRMMQYATHTLFTSCEGVEPTSFAKIVPFLDVKFKIGDFISDLKVISFFLYSYLFFPFFFCDVNVLAL